MSYPRDLFDPREPRINNNINNNPYNPLLSSRPAAGLVQAVYPAAITESVHRENQTRYDIGISNRPCKMIPQIFSVDSRYRNYAVSGRMGATSVTSNTLYPRDQYTVPLPSVYRDTVSLELIKAVIPAPAPAPALAPNGEPNGEPTGPGPESGPLAARGLPVNDAELNDRRYLILSIGYSHMIGNNPSVAGSLCNLYPTPEGGYAYTRGSNDPDAGYTYYFSEPGLLAKLDIRLTYPDGRAPVFQSDHVLTFEIRGLNQPKVLLC